MKEINYIKYAILGYVLATLWDVNNYLYFGLYFLFVCIILFLDIVLVPKYRKVKMNKEAYLTIKKICKLYTIINTDSKCGSIDPALKRFILRQLDESFHYVASYELDSPYSVISLWLHLQEECIEEIKDGDY